MQLCAHIHIDYPVFLFYTPQYTDRSFSRSLFPSHTHRHRPTHTACLTEKQTQTPLKDLAHRPEWEKIWDNLLQCIQRFYATVWHSKSHGLEPLCRLQTNYIQNERTGFSSSWAVRCLRCTIHLNVYGYVYVLKLCIKHNLVTCIHSRDILCLTNDSLVSHIIVNQNISQVSDRPSKCLCKSAWRHSQ